MTGLIGRFTRIVSSFGLLLQFINPAFSSDYPNRAINVLIPFATGGATQALSERVGRWVGADLGQPLVSDHRGGAGGTIAAQAAARAVPDGYTIFMGATGALAVAPAVMSKVNFDPVKDFIPIALIATTPYVVVVGARSPFETIPELVEYARQHPGKLNFASSGTAGADHIAGEVWQQNMQFKMTHVPYKGAGPYLPDLIVGRIDVAIISPIPVKSLVEAGEVRILAVTTAQRSQAPHLKDIPTVNEVGGTGYDFPAWYGYFAPANTPAEVVEKLHVSVLKALKDPAIKEWLIAQGLTPGDLSANGFGQLLRAEVKKWSTFATILNIHVE
jgi:tripartite-type tricarboxylate transporter receptor subunit TctC